MRLRVFLPTNILIDQEVTKIVAEAESGYFGILPKHVDFVTALAPGIFSFEMEGEEEFMAVDEGVLVKFGAEVLVSTRKAIRGKNLGELKRIVEEEFISLDEREKKTRSILAKLEADFTKRFLKMRERANG
jgi:F-type H+-transporting ATPase subunit epsilon